MTPDHIKDALHIATIHVGTEERLDIPKFAKIIQFKVLDEVLAICKANVTFSNDASELFKDLQAYDRYERGFNF